MTPSKGPDDNEPRADHHAGDGARIKDLALIQGNEVKLSLL